MKIQIEEYEARGGRTSIVIMPEIILYRHLSAAFPKRLWRSTSNIEMVREYVRSSMGSPFRTVEMDVNLEPFDPNEPDGIRKKDALLAKIRAAYPDFNQPPS